MLLIFLSTTFFLCDGSFSGHAKLLKIKRLLSNWRTIHNFGFQVASLTAEMFSHDFKSLK